MPAALTPEPEQKRGRPRLTLADIIFSITFKIYSTVSGRRFETDLREAKAKGYLSRLSGDKAYLSGENFLTTLRITNNHGIWGKAVHTLDGSAILLFRDVSL